MFYVACDLHILSGKKLDKEEAFCRRKTAFLSAVRPLGRPRRRWGDNIKMNLREVGGGGGDWMELAQDRDR